MPTSKSKNRYNGKGGLKGEGVKDLDAGEGLGLLPGEDFSSEVTVSSRLLKDGVLELEVLDDAAGSEVEILLDNLHELLLALGAGAVVKHGDRQGLGHADGIRNLKSRDIIR